MKHVLLNTVIVLQLCPDISELQKLVNFNKELQQEQQVVTATTTELVIEMSLP